jgi:hypothetical protein
MRAASWNCAKLPRAASPSASAASAVPADVVVIDIVALQGVAKHKAKHKVTAGDALTPKGLCV